MASPLPAEGYFWRGPRSYTGEDVAEVHTVGCPPLVDLLSARLLGMGLRAAGPGELTMRAFLNGKLDLTRAEAVQAVITAGSRGELRQALARLAGGLARPLGELREELLNLLADLEAGLDFADEDLSFLSQEDLLLRLAAAMARVRNAQRQMESRSSVGGSFRVVLAGPPNAGKSSLFNALTGGRALVSEAPGTTRDYLVATMRIGGALVEVVDTPGREASRDEVESQAQALGVRAAEEAALVLWCSEGGRDPVEGAAYLVATKCDLYPAPPGWLATSVRDGLGLEALREVAATAARAREEPSLAPANARCWAHLEAAQAHLRAAHALALEGDPPELIALEVRLTLDELGQLAGEVFTDDLLDRVFSRFCIGK
jgi:tRNA modification GTPase